MVNGHRVQYLSAADHPRDVKLSPKHPIEWEDVQIAGDIIKVQAAIAIAISVLATGCVSDSPRPEGHNVVPPERLYSSPFLAPAPAAAEVTIRKVGGGFMEKSCFGRLLVENRPVAEMYGSEQIVLYLARGQYSITYVPKGLCQGKQSSVEIQVLPNEMRMFRIHSGTHGDFSIVEVGR